GYRAGRRNRVTRRHETAEAVTALSVGGNGTTQVVLRLSGIKVGIGAVLVGMPNLHGGAGYRLAGSIQHLAFHDHGLANVATIVQARFAYALRRPGHIQRPLDRTRRALSAALLAVGFILANVEQTVKTQTGGDQTGLTCCAQAGQPGNSLPKLVGVNV